jgi:hypothetical protein
MVTGAGAGGVSAVTDVAARTGTGCAAEGSAAGTAGVLGSTDFRAGTAAAVETSELSALGRVAARFLVGL